MQLYLVQHGAANSEVEDPQRRLTSEGAKTVERMAFVGKTQIESEAKVALDLQETGRKSCLRVDSSTGRHH